MNYSIRNNHVLHSKSILIWCDIFKVVRWLQDVLFPDLIRQWWKDLEVSRSAGYRLHLKLKKLKLKIKDWARNQYVAAELVISKILEDIKGMFGNRIGIFSSEDSLKLLELGFAQ